jgi:hemerythrin
MFALTDDLTTGNNFIDDDHRHLIDLINELIAARVSHDTSLTSDRINNLIVFARQHFDREVVEMHRINYLESDAHISAHMKLLRDVLGLKQVLEEDAALSCFHLYRFVSKWLKVHILTFDKALALALSQA